MTFALQTRCWSTALKGVLLPGNFYSNDFQPEKIHKILKITEINIVLCNFSAQQIRKDAYLSGDPQWETHSPKPLSDQLVKHGAAPTTEGIPLRNICFFVLVRKWGWERRREVGGLLKLNHHGNFNNITLPLPPPSRVHTRGNEFQNGDGASTVICFWCLPSNRDIIDLIRTYWQFYYSASYYSAGKLGAAKMLMVHSSLLRAIKEHYEKIFMQALTQFCAVVVECTCHLLSLCRFA